MPFDAVQVTPALTLAPPAGRYRDENPVTTAVKGGGAPAIEITTSTTAVCPKLFVTVQRAVQVEGPALFGALPVNVVVAEVGELIVNPDPRINVHAKARELTGPVNCETVTEGVVVAVP